MTAIIDGTNGVTTPNVLTSSSGVALTLQSGGTTAVTINTSQNVGIGTTSPTQKLQVAGNAFISAGQYFMWDNAGAWSLQSDASTYVRTLINGNEQLRTNAYGIGIGGTTPSSGTGITFPATQNASSDANTLDDYEEGTWTVTDASGAGLSISTGFAFYTKIGDFIFACCDITYPTTSNTSAASFTLPFSGKNYSNGFVGYTSYSTSALYLESNNNSGTMVIQNSAFGVITNAGFSGKRLISTYVYKTS